MLFPVQIRWKQETKLCSHQFLSLHILTTNSNQVHVLQNQETECTLSAVARMFSSPVISCGGIPSPDMQIRCDLIHKRHNAGDWRHFNLHPHLSNESTKLSLVEPVLHHSVCVCAVAYVCVKLKWHSVSWILDVVALLQSWRWRQRERWWCTDTSAACCPFLTDELTCTKVHFFASVWHSVPLHMSSLSLDMTELWQTFSRV